MKKKILFGTGTIAEELSQYIGIDNIEYFADNNISKIGTYFKTKKKILGTRMLVLFWWNKRTYIYFYVN